MNIFIRLSNFGDGSKPFLFPLSSFHEDENRGQGASPPGLAKDPPTRTPCASARRGRALPGAVSITGKNASGRFSR